MANKKISDLTSGSAIGGTEELPIVQSGSTVKTTISAIKTFLESVFVKKGTLTNNYIPKATSSDTIVDSDIYNNTGFVGIKTNTKYNTESFRVNGTSQFDDNVFVANSSSYIGVNDNIGNGVIRLSGNGASPPNLQSYGNPLYINALGNDVKLAHSSSKLNIENLTPSQRVETDASKNLVSVPKGTADNANYGTTAGTVLEGNRITQTITNGVTDKAPSEDAVFDGLTLKVDKNTSITGATKTKITYDSKGLVTSGADATTADIADSLNKRYVTDANLTVIGNTSGTNTGDQTLSGLGGVPTTRSLTINGTTYDLSADRTWTISTASNVAIKDEGSTLTSAVTSIDFIGSAVTTTAVGNDVTVNITGGGVASATNNLFSYYNFI